MKKHKFGKRLLACVVSAATILTGTTILSAMTKTTGVTASAASYDNYAKLLQYSLYFYDANMCGADVGETSQLEWRDDCHTEDAVTGGFHDAGDHVKFGLPAGYSASTLGWSYYEYSDAFDSLGQTSHLKTITDHFCQYFKDCTTLSGNTVTNFCYQIGDGDADHAVWCAPEVQDASTRKAYYTTNGASDIAAAYAAALAVNYINFGNQEDLTYAKALYDFSLQYNTCATDGPNSFYQSYDYYDDQAWAAGWLYLATKDDTYKNFLNTFMTTSNKGSSGQSGCQWGVYSTMSWNNVSAGAAILQAEITGSNSDWAKLGNYMSGKCTSESTYYCEAPWGSCRYNTAMQMMALVTADHCSSINYSSWAKSQMAMILGNNPINTCFVTGFADNSAKYPHHRAASGYDNFDDMTDQIGFASDGHTLIGALVGGPSDSNFTYKDSVNDYESNEVAIDYNATLVGAAAALYARYGTGSLDSSIEGVGSTVTTPATTEATTTVSTTLGTTSATNAPATTALSSRATAATTQATTAVSNTGDTILTPTNGTDTGIDGTLYKYVEFTPSGADSVTVNFNVSSNDKTASVSFGYWNGSEWIQSDDNVSISNGQVSVDFTVPDDVYNTVKFSVYYPGADSVNITQVALHNGTSSNPTTTTINNGNTGNTGSGDTVLTPTNGSEVGEDGALYKYVEFTPGDADSVTVYVNVSSNDKTASVSFGYWNGSEWVQSDDNVSISNGQLSVDFKVPDDVYDKVKFSVYYPGADSVDITQVVLHRGSTSVVTTVTTARTTSNHNNTTTTKTTTANGNSGDTILTPTNGTEIGIDGTLYKYVEFVPGGAASATVYFNVSSNDKTASVSFGYWNGSEWIQSDDNVSISNGTASADFVIPSDVYDKVKLSVYYPGADSVDITQVVLHSSSTAVTTTTANSSGGDTILTPTNGSEAGVDGTIYKYVEFTPGDATSATVYFTVSSNDKTGSVSFGYWNGSEWIQDDQSVRLNGGEVSVDFTIPDDVYNTVKFSVYYPGADSVDITQVVLHSGTSSNPTTTAATTARTTATTRATTTAVTTTTTASQTAQRPSTTTAQQQFSGTLCGDINLDGEVTLADSIMLNKAVVNIIDLTGTARANADVCSNSSDIDGNDAMVLLRFVVQLESSIPTTLNAS